MPSPILFNNFPSPDFKLLPHNFPPNFLIFLWKIFQLHIIKHCRSSRLFCSFVIPAFIIAVFQAVGQSVKPFVLSLLHKCSLDIVLFFIIRKVYGLEHILWASPIMTDVALLVGIILAVHLFHSLHLQEQEV